MDMGGGNEEGKTPSSSAVKQDRPVGSAAGSNNNLTSQVPASRVGTRDSVDEADVY